MSLFVMRVPEHRMAMAANSSMVVISLIWVMIALNRTYRI